MGLIAWLITSLTPDLVKQLESRINDDYVSKTQIVRKLT